MSLRRLVRSVARVGVGFATGGPAGAVAAAITPRAATTTGTTGMMGGLPQSFLPQIGGMAGLGTAIGPLLGRVLPGAGVVGGAVAAGGAVLRSAGAAARAANAWCGRNPAWCVSVGGLPAVLSMVQTGQLPLMKRRRARGLSARDLRGFHKTARLMRRVAGTIGLRRGGGARGRGTSSTMITQN